MQPKPFMTMLSAAAMAAAAFAWSTPVTAQSQPATQQQEPAAVSDADVRSFANAAQELKQINDEVRPRIESADTPEQAQTIRTRAEKRMIAAVEDEGLTVDRYKQIHDMTQRDPDLRARVLRHMRASQ